MFALIRTLLLGSYLVLLANVSSAVGIDSGEKISKNIYQQQEVANVTPLHIEHEEETISEKSEHGANLAPLLFVVLSLFVGAATRQLLRKGPLPYTISLLVIGLILGVLNRSDFFTNFGLNIIGESVHWAGHIDPHLILYLFLPTLIFEAAFALHIHTFKKSFANATILAIPGLLVAMFITAAVILGINKMGIGLSGWSFLVALLFGSIVSATDPVAVVAILKEVGASKKLSTITESESMLNDGTAIVVFMTIFAMITGSGQSENALLEFLRVALGGALVGGAIAWIVVKWIKRVFNDALIEITVIISASYLSFYLAESVFHVSGVISVVTFGIAMAGPGKTRISPGVTHFLHEFWELAAFIANTLIFIIVGVIIAQQVHYTLTDLVVLLIVYVGVHIARLGTIYLFYPIMKRLGYGLSLKDSVVLWWGGLRGAVALALAIIVAIEDKIPLEVRSQLLSLTAGLVVLTSLINATTVRWLINFLGLSKVGAFKSGMYNQAVQQIRLSSEKEIEKLKDNRYMSGANWDRVEEVIIKPDKVEVEKRAFSIDDAVFETRKRLLQKEKESYWRQFSVGMLSSDGVQILSDQIETLLDKGGKVPLSERDDIELLWQTPKITSKLQGLPLIGRFWKKRFAARLAMSYDCARAFVAAQEENIKSLSSLMIGFSLESSDDSKETDMLSKLEDELNENRITGLTFLRNLKEKYSDIGKTIETQLASRSILNHQMDMVERLQKQGRLEPDDIERIEASIQDSMKHILDSSMSGDFKSDAFSTLESSPGISGIDKDKLLEVVQKSQEKVFPTNAVIYREGSVSDGIYVIVNGSVRFEKDGKNMGIREASESFGVWDWFTGNSRRFTVIAETPITAVKISDSVLTGLAEKLTDFEKLFGLAAGIEIAFELLRSREEFVGLSVKKFRSELRKGELMLLSGNEKYRLNCDFSVLVKGKVSTDNNDAIINAPAVLNDFNIRCENQAVLLCFSYSTV
ncbi:MAG TPA: cation:proton antiporter [Tenuifilaceae bacterium]|nr:cation:proton antiporter [Tenuifilaceae bacterium]